MKRSSLTTAIAALAIALSTPASAQDVALHGAYHGGDASAPTLHINPRWRECSFQLSSSLTQSAWRTFTREAGLVTYFRPLSDARPMGKGKVELSMLQWQTNIDDSQPQWNDTFVHPDSSHWLLEGEALAFPGLTVRAGVGAKTDVGVYLTKAPGANYGFYGAQLQRALAGSADGAWAAATRVSVVKLYGPDDVSYAVYGADAVGSRTIRMRWATVSPYASVSTYLGHSHEKSAAVALDDERVLGVLAAAGAALQLSKARLSAEYNVGAVNSFSMKIGFGS
jgi:hypothetical protein